MTVTIPMDVLVITVLSIAFYISGIIIGYRAGKNGDISWFELLVISIIHLVSLIYFLSIYCQHLR